MTDGICEITIVRHGQTQANVDGILQGQIQTPLDKTGILQAEAAAERFKNDHFDVVFCSDLARAYETAKTIMAHHPDTELIPCEELREWNLGDLQGRSLKELWEVHPDIMEAFLKPGDDMAVPGGETLNEFHLRVSSFMDRIAEEYAGKRVLFVSHGGAIQRMFTHVTGVLNAKNVQPFCPNASVSVMRRLPKGWQLAVWGDISHLNNLKLHELMAY